MSPFRFALALPLIHAAAAAAAPAAPLAVVPDKIYQEPRELVAVDGGRKLNLHCEGEGEPAVVLEAGAGNSMVTWRFVQAEIAKFTQVCAYDRAGLGFSDEAERATDLRSMADDLAALANATPIAKPFVLVGHSLGGEMATYYASTHPDEIAGMVLVDPGFPDDLEALQAALPPAKRTAIQDSMARALVAKRACLDLAKAGKLQQPQYGDARACLNVSGDPNRLDYALMGVARQQLAQPKVWDAQISEMESFVPEGDHIDADSAELGSTPFDFGAKPLIVLSRGVDEGAPGVPSDAIPKVEAAWRAGHAALAARSTEGKHVTVAGARHYIQIDKPAAVVDAVRQVVEAARAK